MMVSFEKIPGVTLQRMINILVIFLHQMSKSHVKTVAGKTYVVHLKSNTATSTEGLGIRSSHFKADCE